MEVVELNVGGRAFTTTRSTLCKHGDSMLAAMFCGDLEPGQTDVQGRFFIDRNGDLFAVIISYLRGELLQLPAFGIQRQALAAEAHFYQLQDLEQQLSQGEARTTAADSMGDLQSTFASLTYEEGQMALLNSAKANIGATKVQKICEAMLQKFFLKTTTACCGAQLYTRLHASENLGPLVLVSPICSEHAKGKLHIGQVVLQVPGVAAWEVCESLRQYHSLFEWELRLRGFGFTRDVARDFNGDKIYDDNFDTGCWVAELDAWQISHL